MRPLVGLLVAVALCLAVGSGVASAQSPSTSVSPTSTSAPSPQGTPWPAPTNLSVKAGCTMTNADGSFIPPAERSCTAMVVWAQLPGFSGDYELELSIQPWAPPPGPFERIATLSDSSAVNGELRYEEHFQFLPAMGTVRCYRVRTVINGETGPYSNEACASFAGVIDGPGTAPRPPDTGSGMATGTVVAAGWAAAAVASMIVGVISAIASRRRV